MTFRKCEFDNTLLQQSESGWFNTRAVAYISSRTFTLDLHDKIFKPATNMNNKNEIAILTNHRGNDPIVVDKDELLNTVQSALDDLYKKKHFEKEQRELHS